MADFRIHEDKIVKVINMEVENYHSRIPQAKKVVNMPLKRQPLRPQNIQNVPNCNQAQSKICLKQNEIKLNKQVVSKKVNIQNNAIENKENQNQNQNKVVKPQEKILDLNIFESKEIKPESPRTEIQHFFTLARDHIFSITSEYQEDIYKYLLQIERTVKRPHPFYMQKQPEIDDNMRTILIDWLSSVVEEYNMHPQTLHLAVHYVDTFLSRMSVIKQKFQLVGTAAMFIASKYEEIYPPDAKEFVYLTADTYNLGQLKRMEQLILKVLQFDVCPPTSFVFITHLASALNLQRKTTLLAMYLAELVLLEGNEYLQYYPSQIAYAAIAVARHTLQEKEVWPIQLESFTGYRLSQLAALIRQQHKTYVDSPNKEQKSIQDKYKTVKYGRISLIKPRNLNLDDLSSDDS